MIFCDKKSNAIMRTLYVPSNYSQGFRADFFFLFLANADIIYCTVFVLPCQVTHLQISDSSCQNYYNIIIS